jgi:signal peptidase I
VALTLLVRTFLVQPFFIPSGSMENTLQVGDRVLVNKVSYRLGEISRGDVVVFDGTDSFTTTPAAPPPGGPVQRLARLVGGPLGLAPGGERDFIKRVLGVPGDRVACCDDTGRLTVNGVALDEQAYLFPGDAPSAVAFDVIVPAGRLWLMGDHRGSSQDSRSLLGQPGGGMVPESRVLGRAVSVIWPLGDLRRLGRPDPFTDRALAEQGRGGS